MKTILRNRYNPNKEDLSDLRNDCDCGTDCGFSLQEPKQFMMPTIYSLELTSACNHRCSGCGNVFVVHDSNRVIHSGFHSYLPYEKWDEILMKIQPYANSIKITGGEPTLHPQFEDILNKVDSLGISFSILTNGNWIHPEQLVQFLVKKKRISSILVSLHGHTAEIHDAFTGVKGSFDSICDNIKYAVSQGLRVLTNTVLTKKNYLSIQEIVKFTGTLGATKTVFNRYIGHEIPGVTLGKENLRIAIQEIEHWRRLTNNVMWGNCIPQCFETSSSHGCSAGTAYCTIDPVGNLRPCNHAPLILGNILAQPMSDIWSSKMINSWRSGISSNCHDCAALAQCRGGCRADAMINHRAQDPLMTDQMLYFKTSPDEQLLSETLFLMVDCEFVDSPMGGYVLFNDKIIEITQPEIDILRTIQKQPMTFAQVEKVFGADALTPLADLCVSGAIKFG